MMEYSEDNSIEDVSLSDWERQKVAMGDEVIKKLKKSGIPGDKIHEQWELFRMKMDELDEAQDSGELKKLAEEFFEQL